MNLKNSLRSAILRVAVLVGAMAAVSLFAQQAVQSFLTIPGIEGESTDAEFPKSIDIHGFSFGVKGPVSLDQGQSQRVGKPMVSPVTVIKNVDRATLDLFIACLSGKTIPSAEIAVRNEGATKQKAHYKITLYDVTIASMNNDTAVNGTTGSLIESVALTYSRVKLSHTSQKPDGTKGDSSQVGWDITKNKQL